MPEYGLRSPRASNNQYGLSSPINERHSGYGRNDGMRNFRASAMTGSHMYGNGNGVRFTDF